MTITPDMLDNWFRFHAVAKTPARYLPDATLTEPIRVLLPMLHVLPRRGDGYEVPPSVAYEAIRAAGREFARVVVALTPPSADQTTAVRTIREAVMWANAAIACEGR